MSPLLTAVAENRAPLGWLVRRGVGSEVVKYTVNFLCDRWTFTHSSVLSVSEQVEAVKIALLGTIILPKA